MSSVQLGLRQSQSLVMTQKLQQALKLLQSSNADLTEYLKQEVLENPFIDIEIPGTNDYESSFDNEDDFNDQSYNDDNYDDYDSMPETDSYDSMLQHTTEDHLDYNSHENSEEPLSNPLSEDLVYKNAHNTSFDNEDFDFLETITKTKTLSEHINEQISLSFQDIKERFIAMTVADYIDDCGWLTTPLQSIATEIKCPLHQVKHIVTKLQEFSPTGIFARSLQECLSLQLNEQNKLTPAMKILLNNLPLLAQKEKRKLAKLCQVTEEELLNMVKIIRTLNPKPSQGFEQETVSTKIADVLVTQMPNRSWKVSLNPDSLPKVLINKEYSVIVPPKGEEKKFFKEKMSHAQWLVKNLQQRADTILKVGTAILEKQYEFFNVGIQALKPLTLKDIATAVEMHESTISRVSIKKYMDTPHGIFELKFFFNAGLSSHISSDNHSAEAVRHRIKILIDNEPTHKPISDNKIAQILSEEGIEIARRTITKYRENMNIPSSSERKQLKKIF